MIAWQPPDDAGDQRVPRSEREALIDGEWRFLRIVKVDAEAGTIETLTGNYPISSARVLDDAINIK